MNCASCTVYYSDQQMHITYIYSILFIASTPTSFNAADALKHVGVLMIYKILLIYMLCICWYE